MHPIKTKIVYCKDADRKLDYPDTRFDFLGYTFMARGSKNKYGKLFTNFLPAVSKDALKAMNTRTRKSNFRNKTELSLNDISRIYNPILRGWYNYYGAYYRSALDPLWRHFNKTLVAWAMRKYKKLKGKKTKTTKFLTEIMERNPKLFVHWEKGIKGSFA